jgi:hypothetical protein
MGSVKNFRFVILIISRYALIIGTLLCRILFINFPHEWRIFFGQVICDANYLTEKKRAFRFKSSDLPMQILWAFRCNPLRPTGFSRFARRNFVYLYRGSTCFYPVRALALTGKFLGLPV